MAGTAAATLSLQIHPFIYLFMNMTLTVDYRTYHPLISSIPRIPLDHVLPTRVALYRCYGRYI